MEDIFIKNIYINKVRHLEKVDIPLSDTERKHLILTGKNGSGKTSVLLEIKHWLRGIESNQLLQVQTNKALKKSLESKLTQLERKLLIIEEATPEIRQEIQNNKNALAYYQKEIDKFQDINIDFSSADIFSSFQEGTFILSFFAAKRNLQTTLPQGIKKVDFRDKYGVDETIGNSFVQHIVNLKADRSFARDENDQEAVNQINNWFDSFEKGLQNILDDDTLKLEFDRKNYNFSFVSEGKEVSNFTTLSDGYSTIINIVSELIMRMENKASKSYDIQGIVLIDEIETHLHIDLQKKILPFLASFFPKIQFIVTTHSPFVLNSVKNAVVFDLEKKLKVEDLSGYSVNSIIENYFGSDQYSDVVKEKVTEYERLLNKTDLTEEEEETLFDLKEYFDDLPTMFSPELSLKISQLQLANLDTK